MTQVKPRWRPVVGQSDPLPGVSMLPLLKRQRVRPSVVPPVEPNRNGQRDRGRRRKRQYESLSVALPADAVNGAKLAEAFDEIAQVWSALQQATYCSHALHRSRSDFANT